MRKLQEQTTGSGLEGSKHVYLLANRQGNRVLQCMTSSGRKECIFVFFFEKGDSQGFVGNKVYLHVQMKKLLIFALHL